VFESSFALDAVFIVPEVVWTRPATHANSNPFGRFPFHHPYRGGKVRVGHVAQLDLCPIFRRVYSHGNLQQNASPYLRSLRSLER